MQNSEKVRENCTILARCSMQLYTPYETCIPQHPRGNNCMVWGFECCEWVFVLRRNPTRWNLGEQFFKHAGMGSRSRVGPGFGPLIVHKSPQVFANARLWRHKHRHQRATQAPTPREVHKHQQLQQRPFWARPPRLESMYPVTI